jgi:polyhydroxyalkanoate synthesis repressor PhaR
MAYVIKRYSNRKLYDLQQSRYVTLDALERMIGEGKDLSVVDARTGDDLTSITLVQILLERERSRRGMLPPALLHQMIRHGETWQNLAQQTLGSGVEGAVPTHQEQDQTGKVWAAQPGLTPPAESGERPEASRAPASDAERLRAEVEALKEKLRELEQKLAESGER